MRYSKPDYEVADIIRSHRIDIEKSGRLNAHKKKVFTNLSQCRTEALGYHKDKCDSDDCDNEHFSYNSCRDRHCPKCNGLKREKWILYRQEDLLPVKYFHTVFTVPHQVNYLFINHPVIMYNLLFKTVWDTIKQFASDHKHLGAKTGMTCILHSWGQNLDFHNHIHCIIPGGGITPSEKWKNTRNEGKFLFPVKALSKVFRGKFTDELIKLSKKGLISLKDQFDEKRKYLHPFYNERWVVFAKQPMLDAEEVVKYIGRYTHRIAISNHRIKSFKDGKVSFSWFDYRTSKIDEMELTADEFLRRFSMHILPSGFMKIRHYGIMSSRGKKISLEIARCSLNTKAPVSVKGIPWQELFLIIYGHEHDLCPKCKKGRMKRTASYLPEPRGSPHLKRIKPNFNFCMQ